MLLPRFSPFLSRCAALALAGTLAACSGPQQAAPQAPAPDAAAQREAAAAKDLAMYEQLRKLGNLELAAPIGRQLLQKYPGTKAAAQVQASIADVESSAKESGEKRRLAALWLYQSGVMDGGAQNTATIAPSVPAGNPIRLILRKHADWGRSVYLYGVEPGFTCAADCRVSVKFDDAAPQKLRASLPPTGEPAMFVEDDEIFLAKMAKAREVTIEATPKGKAPVALRFEVGGYDAAKWPDVSKSAKATKAAKKK